MLLRTYIATVFLTWCIFSQGVVAQVVECPGSLAVSEAASQRTVAAAEDLLGSFVGALNLRGRRAFNEAELVSRYAHNPSELLIKLRDLDIQCLALSQDDRFSVDERQQIMRRRFLEAVLTTSDGTDADVQQAVQDIEGELSIREQSRELWFQEAEEPLDDTNRWAVIVASPAAATAWEELKAHQERWPQIHFELHVPYHDSNPYYAIVVGRRLSEMNASKLVEIVQQAGMASDSYRHPLPRDKADEGVLAGKELDYLAGETENVTFPSVVEDKRGGRAETQPTITVRSENERPASEDTQGTNLELIPAQAPAKAEGVVERFWRWLLKRKQLVAKEYRPDCGLAASDQVSGVPYCARDNDRDRGSGTQATPGRGAGGGTGGGTGGGGGPKNPDDPC